jgi:hypothetical protein
MARLVFLVSRERPELSTYLKREFAGNDEIEVIVDRRLAQRRAQEPVAAAPERRRGDRRQEQIDDRLRAMGWAIVWRTAETTVFAQGDED